MTEAEVFRITAVRLNFLSAIKSLRIRSVGARPDFSISMCFRFHGYYLVAAGPGAVGSDNEE